jgi:hypothetical protein
MVPMGAHKLEKAPVRSQSNFHGDSLAKHNEMMDHMMAHADHFHQMMHRDMEGVFSGKGKLT